MNGIVIMPYVRGKTYEQSVYAILNSGADARLFNILHDDSQACAEIICTQFNNWHNLVYLGMDVAPGRQAIQQLLACPEPWCTHEVWTGGKWETMSLGIAHFRPSKLWPTPGSLYKVLHPGGNTGGWMHWTGVDSAIARDLLKMGFQPHVHEPRATHLHDYGE